MQEREHTQSELVKIERVRRFLLKENLSLETLSKIESALDIQILTTETISA